MDDKTKQRYKDQILTAIKSWTNETFMMTEAGPEKLADIYSNAGDILSQPCTPDNMAQLLKNLMTQVIEEERASDPRCLNDSNFSGSSCIEYDVMLRVINVDTDTMVTRAKAASQTGDLGVVKALTYLFRLYEDVEMSIAESRIIFLNDLTAESTILDLILADPFLFVPAYLFK
jgi:hypothetical protein